MTVCGGWSLQAQDRNGLHAITLWCRSWACADCAPHRVNRLKREAAEGNPSTFITLTVNPAVGQSPTDRARELSDAWRVVVKRARRRWPKAPLEYLAVFEETKRGEPHLHILARAPYIPQRWLSEQMSELIAAPVVDIRRVASKRHAANYVAKYVGKGPKSFGSLKRYWSSPGYREGSRRRTTHDDARDMVWSVEKLPLWRLAQLYRQMGFDVLEVSSHELLVDPLIRAGPTRERIWPIEFTERFRAGHV